MEKNKGFFITLAALILFSGFVFAAHIVTTSTGGTSYNYNDSATNTYNITVNNTDIDAAANITQVNITIPSSFGFISSSQSVSNSASFTSSGNVLSWLNTSGIIMNASWNYFSFNANSTTPGNYNITVTTVNATGSFSSNISVRINDTTVPNINFTLPVNGLNSSLTFIIFNMTAQDFTGIDTFILRISNATALINTTMVAAGSLPLYLNLSNLTEGLYSYNVTVNDTLNNVNVSETRTVRLDRTSPGISLGENADTETTINVTATITESGSGIGSGGCTAVSGTVGGSANTWYIYRSGLTCETDYTYNVTCTDRAGNAANVAGTFATETCSDSSSSGGGGSDSTTDAVSSFWTNTYVVSDTQLSGGYVKQLQTGHRFSLKVDNETHYVGVIKITATRITINVSSTPQQAILSVGDTKDFEVSDDGFYDLRVKLQSINSSSSDYTANVSITSIHEKVPVSAAASTSGGSGSNPTPTELNAADETSSEDGFFTSLLSKIGLPSFFKNKWFWIGLVLAISIIGGGILFIRKEEGISSRVKMQDDSSNRRRR